MVESKEGLFRKVAIEHYLKGEEGGSVLRISPPWTWALFWFSAAVVTLALVASAAFQVEVTGYGRGAVRPVQGVRTLVAPVGGIVERIERRPGDGVQTRDPILWLDSASIRGQILEADRQLQVLRTDFTGHTRLIETLGARQESELRQKLIMLQDQVQSQEGSLPYFTKKLLAHERLEQEGLVSAFQVDEMRESLAQARRQLNVNRQLLASATQELAAFNARLEEERWRRSQELRDAQNKRDALDLALAQTRVLAPIDSTVDAIFVKTGDVVQQGQAIGRLLPSGTPLEVIAFLPEKDRASVVPGQLAKVEFEQFPFVEFGTLPAKVIRVAGDLATSQEILQVLGDGSKLEGAVYRIELQLLESNNAKLNREKIRSGMLLQVRFALRKQRPITILLDPLRRWFD